MRTTFYKEILQVVRDAGYEFARRNNSHEIYRKKDCAQIVIPRKMDDPRIYHRILKQVALGS